MDFLTVLSTRCVMYYTECDSVAEIKTMTLKKQFLLRIEAWAGQLGPVLEETWRDARQRLDELNRSLASHAVPGERRKQVSELALRSKGRQAGQTSADIRPFPEYEKARQRSDFDQ